jgi:hypothetical protein
LSSLTDADFTVIQKATITAEAIIFGLVLRITGVVLKRFMSKYGKQLMGTFQKDMSYIIKTATRLTTECIILTVLNAASTLQNIIKDVWQILNAVRNRLSMFLKHLKLNRHTKRPVTHVENPMWCATHHHTDAPPAKKGIGTRTEEKGRIKLLAGGAERSILRLKEQLNSVLNGVLMRFDTQIKKHILESTLRFVPVRYAERTLEQQNQEKQPLVRRIARILKGQRQLKNVYDLEVEGAHEFFANGVLCHNCAAFIDEIDELPAFKAVSALKAVNERCRQNVEDFRAPFLVFASTSQGLKGLYQIYRYFKRAGVGFCMIRARTRDNVFLPVDYVESLYKTYNKNEVACLLDADFVPIESGKVYPDFDPAVNVLDYDLLNFLHKGERVYIAQDFNIGGYKAVAAVLRGGIIYLVKEYDFKDVRVAPGVFRADFPVQSILWIPDMTYKEHFPSFARELRAARINLAFRKSNPIVSDSVFVVNKLLYTCRLMVCSFCKNVVEAFELHQKDPKTGAPMKGQSPDAPDHILDCVRYLSVYIVLRMIEMKDIYDVTLGRKEKFIRQNEFEAMERQYQIIDV